MSKKRSTHSRFRGQALVEFALVLPFLLVLMYGLFETGRLVFIYGSTISASREAVRYGSAVGRNDAGALHYQDCDGIRNAARRVGLMAGISDADVTITYDHGPGTAAYDTCDGSIDTGVRPISGDRINVTVIGEYVPAVAIVPLPAQNIDSTSHRTILVRVDIVQPDGPPQYWNP